MRAEIVFEPATPFKEKPEIFTSGGYSGVTKDGELICFDWEEFYASIADDSASITVTHRNFDFEFFNDSNESLPEFTTDEAALGILKTIRLDEVYYECFADGKEMEHIDLKVKSFILYNPYSGETLHEFNLDKVNLEQGVV